MKQTALLGNPNIGKTSLFNALTGSYEYVGNWSGVTVEKKVGQLKSNSGEIIDLPGVYSLTPLSKDEAVVIQFFLNDLFSSILNIVDASQLERNLMLTLQLLEFHKPTIIGLNMLNIAKKRGFTIDEEKLAQLLQVPVIAINARTGESCDHLLTVLHEYSTEQAFQLDYGELLEQAIEKIVNSISHEQLHVPARWLALQILDGNTYAIDFVSNWISKEQLEHILRELRLSIETQHHMSSIDRWIYEQRRRWIQSIVEQCTIKLEIATVNWTTQLDAILTNRIFGIPIFFALMFLMFKATFDWIGTPLSDLLDAFISGPITNILQYLLNAIDANAFLNALVFDGIVAGVGGVLVFVPQIFVLFFFISVLEDSGYMSRAALVMDRMLEKVGLNGKSFIPMIIGLGCNVPGVMAARTIEQPKERLITTLLVPLMSCSARLPVYALFAGAFFKKHQSIVVFSLYLLGIVVAIILAKVFSSTLLKNETSIFAISLPPYRVPHGLTLWRSTWDKGKGFIRKAGTFIFAGSVIIWFLSYAGPGGIDVAMDDSFLALIGGIIAPILAPLGFGTWQAGASLLTGFIAKEVVVATMNIIYHVPDTVALQEIIMQQYTPLSAYSFMVFILLYIPCLATVAAIRNEVGSAKWTAFSIGYSLILAYVLSFTIYHLGLLFL